MRHFHVSPYGQMAFLMESCGTNFGSGSFLCVNAVGNMYIFDFEKAVYWISVFLHLNRNVLFCSLVLVQNYLI